ncbi:MAG: hypothetical protein IMX00_05515 [Limnochordales bacterium]|nr:hypothetical protein [Limnochordales bacterium]
MKRGPRLSTSVAALAVGAVGLVLTVAAATALAPLAEAAGWSTPVLWEHSGDGTDRMPWIYGNTLYLVWGRYDIYYSTYDEALGSWSEPQPVPGAVNTSANNEINPVVVGGGKVLYFARYNPLTDYDFYRSEWDEEKGEWGEPVKIEAWSTDAQEWDLWVNEDETVAYLTSRGSFGGQAGLGGQDVWKSVKVNGQWTTPVNLGAPINTPGDEWSIFVGPDGKIYIDSNREGTVGKMDIFVAADEKSAPQSLGVPINGPTDERELAFNDKWLFISAIDRDGRKGYDIYVARWQD